MFAYISCLCFRLLNSLQRKFFYVKIETKGYDLKVASVKNEKYIPTKNYITALVLVVVVIVLTLYFFKWYDVFKENKVSSSYLIKSNTITNEIKDLKEVEAVFTEVPDDYFIYISYTNDEKVYEMEKELKNVINDYSLNDKFYFINITDIQKEDNYIDKLNATLDLGEQKITKVPTIIYYQNGKIAKDGILVRADDNIINASDLQQFLEEKDYQKW